MGYAADRLFDRLDTLRLGMQPLQCNLSKVAALHSILENIYDAQERLCCNSAADAAFPESLSPSATRVLVPVPMNPVTAAATHAT